MPGSRPAPGRRACGLLLALVALLAGACSGSGTDRSAAPSAVASVTTVAPTTGSTPPTVTATSAVPAGRPTSTVAAVAPTSTVAAVAGSTFSGTVSPVTAADLGTSWRPGCPVAPDDLRLLRLSYWGFDAQPHVGSLVVAASATDALLGVFRTLYDQRFPIRRMDPVDVYGSDDDASMAVDNTSAFNCRPAVSDGPPHWSNHAFGLAVDVNPIENPYLLGGRVLPPAGADFVDRSVYRPGMAVDGGVLTSAFAAVGWGWGGVWSSPDYQHFSSTGG